MTWADPQNLPRTIDDVEQLEDLLSEPSPAVVELLGRIDGNFIVLGVGGKMGPSLARMLRRAADQSGRPRKIFGVSRFTSAELPARLRGWGVEPVAVDLLEPDALSGLPDAANVIFMAGMKFGTTGQQARTWAINTWLPGMIARRFRDSRLVVFSTGNVYPMVAVHGGGCAESDETAPVGDYAMSCLGRERVFEHFSRELKIPMAVIRLNYAVELRYGVLVDIGQRVWAGEAVDVTMGNFNAIWQADASAMAIAALAHAASPPTVLNVTGPETLSVRAIARELGILMGKVPVFRGAEMGTALLNDASRSIGLFGYPRVSTRRLLEWIADWICRGNPTLGKPTHFQTRDGKF